MNRVAPLGAVNSSSGHMVLTTTGGQCCGSGYTESSRCSTWAVSPGPMRMPTGALSW